MRTVPESFTDEPTGQLQEVPHLSQENHYQEALQALDLVDTFVLAHSELEFREFFRRLQNLDAWHELLANLDAL
jgi:hypothetical protein